MSSQPLPASFRDPDGYLFKEAGKVLRQINSSYQTNYEKLMTSGLYDSLVKKKWLIPHNEKVPFSDSSNICIIEPEQLQYVSYPYEWSFSQLKDAALLTMKIQLEALKFGMILKDASAYNVQFHQGRCVFIDTLSFETYQEGAPWIAYKQFCQHFLAPLALISYCDYRTLKLTQSFIDGTPLDLASQLLPTKTWFKYSLLAHIHLHAKTQKRYEDVGRDNSDKPKVKVGKVQLNALMESLKSAVNKLDWEYANTEWGDYYSDTNYEDEAMQHKALLLAEYLGDVEKSATPIAADFGANTGKFSRIAAEQGYFVLSHDVDEVAVDRNYRELKANKESAILPLLQDFVNPSPAIGWANQERSSFIERCQVDVGLALAIIHHISISNNVPFSLSSAFLAKMCKSLIIEFVPKEDSQVKRLLATREDVFPDYNLEGFIKSFSEDFEIIKQSKINGCERTLVFMKRK